MRDDLPLEQRFTLEDQVGRGAWGEVYRASDRETGSRVAVKRLLSHHVDPAAADRFRREARLLARVESPHVVRYVAHGLHEARPCLVVEWLEGEDLGQRARRRRLSPAEAIEAARQAAVGLAALHEAGIVHRDVKPSNLFLVGDEGIRVKLIDLGVARGTLEATLTTVGHAVGTPFYMSPEQARGDELITPAADLFSLGAMLFEQIAGKRPFTGDDLFAVLAKIVLSDPPRLRTVAAEAPVEVDDLIWRAMQKLPSDRFASALSMSDALAALPSWEAEDSSPAEGDDAPTATATSALAPSSLSLAGTLEQRVVTAVFAGFPAGAGEEGHAAAFSSIAAESGGAAHPMLGRRMIAVFGGARTTGDEVLRAARAALVAHGKIPGVRLAIATGRAIASIGGLSGEVIERGTDEALRATLAIRIDEATARMLADHFVIEEEPGGRTLRRERPIVESVRRLVGKATPCVGRDRELATLEATFAECASEPIARPVLVTGAAGVGKSRALLGQGRTAEALAWARKGVEVLVALGTVEEFDVLAQVSLAEALDATGDREGAKATIATVTRVLLARAARVRDPAVRERLLGNVPDNARALALARAWGVALE